MGWTWESWMLPTRPRQECGGVLAPGSQSQPCAFPRHPLPPEMDTPAAARRAKRSKPEAPKSAEQEDAKKVGSIESAGAPDSSPPGAGGDEPYVQDPPPGVAGGEEEDGVDRISSLPDAILGEVISLLPTKEAARTQTLATRWRHLWCSAPLNLDVGDLRTINDVSRILSAHQGPGRRFRFHAHGLWKSPATVDSWLQSPALDNLQEIDCFATNGFMLKPPSPPPSTFRFSSSLCVATFSECHLSEDLTRAFQFPRLKKLALQRVVIVEDSLHSIIAACPVLECLMLREIRGVCCVRINSASLTSIGVCGGYDPTMICLEEFILEDAPCLKRILYVRSPRMGAQVSVISAPNLETLGCLNFTGRSFRLLMGSMIIEPCNIKGFQVTNLTTPACSVKSLAVCTDTLSLDAIIDLMRCFPSLEKLYIKSYQGVDQNLWRRKHHILIKGLDIHLKTVVLNIFYRGIKSQVNFATFFVLNAKLLESMTFECETSDVTDSFLAEQHHVLQLEKRASRCARFYFASKGCLHEFMHINHAHDLSKTDPFECEERGRCMRIL